VLTPPLAGPIVPSGRVWVVREVAAMNVQNSNTGGGIGALHISVGPIDIFATPLNGTMINYLYSVIDTRFVVDQGEELVASSSDFHWGWRITGYSLSK
jgi:hypothetical protein